MGPRPSRPGAAALTAKASARVEVVRHPRRGAPPAPSVPLPPAVCAAVAAITRDMRDVPRACIGDPAELLHWLRRMARRVEGLGAMRVPGVVLVRPEGRRLTPAAAIQAPTPREAAEALFARGVGSTETLARLPASCIVVSRRGRAVRVEVRRTRAAGQMELPLSS